MSPQNENLHSSFAKHHYVKKNKHETVLQKVYFQRNQSSFVFEFSQFFSLTIQASTFSKSVNKIEIKKTVNQKKNHLQIEKLSNFCRQQNNKVGQKQMGEIS